MQATLATGLYDWLAAMSGTAALGFIVALALGIAAMTVLFMTSAVVVLDRFARVAHHPGWLAAVAIGWSALVALELRSAVGLDPALDEAARSQALMGAAIGGLVATLLAMGLVALALRWLRPGVLAGAVLVWLGLGYALVVVGVGHAEAGAVGLLFALATALWLRRRERPAAARAAFALAGILGLAWVSSLAVPFPPAELAGVGVFAIGALLALVLLGLLPLAAAGLLGLRGRVEWFIALRYLVAKRRQTFISVISLICMGGVAVGVWLIITVLSVMNGFERTWRDEVIGNRAHFVIQSYGGTFGAYREVLATVLGIPRVVTASPYVDADGMVRGDDGEIVAIRLRGIDPANVGAIPELNEDMLEGTLDDFEPRVAEGLEGPSLPGIVIGNSLANRLGFRIGDPILVISPFGGPETPLGPAPRLKRFRVSGVFESSYFQFDQVFTYTDLPAAQDFRRSGNDEVEGILVLVEDYFRSQAVGDDAEAALGLPFYTRDWKQFFPSFFQALKTERVTMFILLTMIIVVAAFMIVATLIMMIMEKSSDIAILKTMGAGDDVIERIFAIEGTLIGLVGTGLGVAAGVVVTTQLDWIQGWVESLFGIDALPENVYPLSTFPWEFDALQITTVVTLAMVLSLGATLLPSRQGAQLDPAEALRYE